MYLIFMREVLGAAHSQQGHFFYYFKRQVLGSSPLQEASHSQQGHFVFNFYERGSGGYALLYWGLRTPSRVIFHLFKLALAGLQSA